MRAALDGVWNRVADVLSRAKQKATQVHAEVLSRIRVYLGEMLDGALAQIRVELAIGGRTGRLGSVKVSQKVALTGSLKAALSEACELAASGELSIEAEYSFA